MTCVLRYNSTKCYNFGLYKIVTIPVSLEIRKDKKCIALAE
jgi:hypothetical protein